MSSIYINWKESFGATTMTKNLNMIKQRWSWHAWDPGKSQREKLERWRSSSRGEAIYVYVGSVLEMTPTARWQHSLGMHGREVPTESAREVRVCVRAHRVRTLHRVRTVQRVRAAHCITRISIPKWCAESGYRDHATPTVCDQPSYNTFLHLHDLTELGYSCPHKFV